MSYAGIMEGEALTLSTERRIGMNEQAAMTFTAKDENGQNVTMEIVLAFTSEISGKDYLVYTDHSCDENGNVRLYASAYVADGETCTLLPIETKAEWEEIEEMIESTRRESRRRMAEMECDEHRHRLSLDDIF